MKTDLGTLFEPLAEMGTGVMVGVIGFYVISVILLLLWRPVITLLGVAAVFALNGFDIVQSLAWLAMLLPIGGFVAFFGLLIRKAKKGKQGMPAQPSTPLPQPQSAGIVVMSCGVCYWDESGTPQYNRDECQEHGQPRSNG